MDEYLGIDAPKKTVIDFDEFCKDHNDRFYNPTSTNITKEIYAGSDISTYIEEITKKTKFKFSLAAGPFNSDTKLRPFTGSIDKTSNYNSTHSYTSKYSFGKGISIKRVKRLYIKC